MSYEIYKGGYEDFDDKAAVAKEFRTTLPDDVEILFARYNCGNYEGEAFVMYRQGNTLYEVNGSHCSCFGLEGQWEPEETSVKALEYRVVNGTLGKSSYMGYDWSADLLAALKEVCDV